MGDTKKMPCWVKLVALSFLIIFVSNWPRGSAEWAAWVQAAGVVIAILVGFVSRAIERRRSDLEHLDFLHEAVEDLQSYLESLEALMTVKDPSSGEMTVYRPRDPQSINLRLALTLIDQRQCTGIQYSARKELSRAVIELRQYLRVIEEPNGKDVQEAIRDAYRFYDIDKQKRTVEVALDAISAQREILRKRSLLELTLG